MAERDDTPLLGDRYRLVERIGSGGMAEVWRATDERLGRDVAVKLFRDEAGTDVARNQDEVRTLARLSHPGLVGVYDVGETGRDDGLPGERGFVVMQLVDGGTLADVLASRQGLAHGEIAHIGVQVAEALAYVHGEGIIHRDVKPGNVLLSQDGRALLADFGIARLVDATSRHTRTGDTIGTPAYFAPEQVAGEAVGPASDIYALGLVLLECFTGRREYDGTAVESALARLSRRPAVPTDLPPGWTQLLTAMTERDPTARPSAADVAAALRTLEAGGVPAPLGRPGVTTTQPMAAATQVMSGASPTGQTHVLTDGTVAAAPAARSRYGLWTVIAIVILALVAAGIAVALTRSQAGSVPQYVTPGHPVIHDPTLEHDVQQLEGTVR